MKAHIAPSICSGHVVIPPSKSMAHRAIICASLANGTSVIKNVAYSQDIKTTIAGMQQLGADIRIEADQVTVTGIKDFTIKNKEVFCCESDFLSLQSGNHLHRSGQTAAAPAEGL